MDIVGCCLLSTCVPWDFTGLHQLKKIHKIGLSIFQLPTLGFIPAIYVSCLKLYIYASPTLLTGLKIGTVQWTAGNICYTLKWNLSCFIDYTSKYIYISPTYIWMHFFSHPNIACMAKMSEQLSVYQWDIDCLIRMYPQKSKEY